MDTAAIDTFRSAIAQNPLSPTAHHDLAFALDREGLSPDEVELHYQRALELSLTNEAVWWGHLVCFLITRAQTNAALQAWHEAITETDGRHPSPYDALHVPVARMLLHRGQLAFANAVIDNVPKAVYERSPALQAIRRRLVALEEAKKIGGVLPWQFLKRDWHQSGPFLVPRERNGKPLRAWFPAKVDRIDDVKVYCRIATVTGDASPELYSWELTIDDYHRLFAPTTIQPAVGQFVEVGMYGDDPATEFFAVEHCRSPWVDPDLPPPMLDPVRYLRRAGWITT